MSSVKSCWWAVDSRVCKWKEDPGCTVGCQLFSARWSTHEHEISEHLLGVWGGRASGTHMGTVRGIENGPLNSQVISKSLITYFLLLAWWVGDLVRKSFNPQEYIVKIHSICRMLFWGLYQSNVPFLSEIKHAERLGFNHEKSE